jgi:hypothetical protein
MSGSDRRSERSAESRGDLEEDRAGECDEPQVGYARPPAATRFRKGGSRHESAIRRSPGFEYAEPNLACQRRFDGRRSPHARG